MIKRSVASRRAGARAGSRKDIIHMNHARLCFVASVAIALAAACSSSSTPGSPATGDDAGSSDAAAADTSTDAASIVCTPLQKCGQGLTCCFHLAGDPTGTCTTLAACTGAVSYQCLNATDCTGTEVCCLSGLNPATFDAAAFDGALPPNLNLSMTCNAACTGQQSQICKSTTECTGGQVCVTQTQSGVTAGFCTTPDGGGSEASVAHDGAVPSDGAASDSASPADAASGG